MSMRDYPLSLPLAFLIDESVAPYIILNDMRKNGEEIPSEIQMMCAQETFDIAVRESDFALIEHDFFCTPDAAEALGDLCYSTSEFDGTVTFLGPDGEPSVKHVEYEDDFLAYILPDKETSPFEAAYSSVEEFAEEVRAKLEPTGLLPEGFDYAAHIVSIDGTYFG